MSDDGRYAIVVIAMLGNVFSPWYAEARQHGNVDPLMHSTMNISIHELGKAHYWSLSERGRHEVTRSEHHLQIGANEMEWRGDSLYLNLNDKQAPFRNSLRGSVRLTPKASSADHINLDTAGEHIWRPYASTARIEASFESPSLHFSGNGYFDSNRGNAPLEDTFRRWSWGRFTLQDGSIVVAYDCELKNGRTTHSLRRIEDSHVALLSPNMLSDTPLPRIGWGIDRSVKSDEGASAKVVAELLSSPFYGRSIVRTTLFGQPALGVHEVVSLERFSERWVRFLLPFRMIDARHNGRIP